MEGFMKIKLSAYKALIPGAVVALPTDEAQQMINDGFAKPVVDEEAPAPAK